MILTTLLAASLSAGTPLLPASAAVHCNPQPSKSLGCRRDAPARPAVLGKAPRVCNPHPGKSVGCNNHAQSAAAERDVLANRKNDDRVE